MACQKLFRTKYVDFLIDQVNKGIKLEQYYGFSFPYDERQVLSVPKILKPEGLIYKMNTEDNCASGIALFEAFPYLFYPRYKQRIIGYGFTSLLPIYSPTFARNGHIHYPTLTIRNVSKI